MRYSPISLEEGWQPKKIVGNTAYYYNSNTGQTKSEFVPNSELSQRKKEFADWFKIHSKFRTKGIYGNPVLIPRIEYVKLNRDPLAPFDFDNISKREGIVTEVHSANEFVIDNSYVVTVPGIKIPTKRNDPVAWSESKQFAERLVLGRKVYLSVNMNNPYAENGNILASMDFNIPSQELKNQQDQEWGIFDYLNIPGYATGSFIRNIAIMGQTGQFGTTTIGDRYSLSDTFTFTRMYAQLTGKAKPLSLYGKGETEGEWYEKIAVDIFGDPSNLISIEGKGVSLFGRRLLKGARYMKPIGALQTSTTRWMNTFGSHVRVAGLGGSIDTINRAWRRVNMLLEPAYYTVNTQLDVWNSVYLGGMNPARYLDIRPILSKADNPIFRKTLGLKVPGKPGGGYTFQELKAYMIEYDIIGKSGGIGDVMKYGRQGLSDKFWNPLIRAVGWQSDTTRGALFIDGLKRGLPPDMAAARVKQFLLDYDPRHLTAFEQAYINRIYPYYIPQTRNIALQVEQALAKPYKYTSVAKWQIQQRQFAGQDQFKDYDRNTILQKVGDGKYIKIRFPLEDITQFPSKYSSTGKALLSSTYPIYNMFPELYQDIYYFDETTPSSNYPKYFAKKFISREYYAWRDWNNANMPISEFLSKHVLGVSFITPNNRQSYQQSLIDAGYSPSEALQEAENDLKRQKYFQANSMRMVAKAQSQSLLPPSQQDRPQINIDKMADVERLGWVEGGVLEKFQFPQFALVAVAHNIGVLAQTGKMGDKGVLDRIPPSAELKALEQKYNISIADKLPLAIPPFLPQGLLAWQASKEQRREVTYQAIDIILDPLWTIKWLPLSGRVVQTLDGVKVLSPEGRAIFAKLNPVIVSGRAEGLYGKQAAKRMAIEADAKFLKYIDNNPALAGKMMQASGIQLFGRTVLKQQTIRNTLNLFKPIAEVPARAISAVAKEIKDVMAPVGKAIADKMLPAEKLRIKWKDDFQKEFDVLQQGIKELKQQSNIAIDNHRNYALRKLNVWNRAKDAMKADPIHGYFWHLSKLSDETGTELTNFIELGKKNPSAQGVIDDVVHAFDKMADLEIDRGILKTRRINYAEHILTKQYKFLRGYTDPVLSRLNIKAPFAKHRWYEGTIAEQNAEVFKKQHVQKFEANIWKIWKIRKAQHIEAIEIYDFLRRVADTHGVENNFFNKMYLRNTYGVSKIPAIQDVLLPIETITALEKIPILRAHIATITIKPGILRRTLENYDSLIHFYKRNIIMWNPYFLPKNTISSFHQNIMAGMYNVAKYLPRKDRNGIAFTTNEGRNIYAWELDQWYQDYKIDVQPGMAGVITKRPQSENALDAIGRAPRWMTMGVEGLVRRALFNQKIAEGFSPADAAKAVENAHLDYTKKYGAAMEIAARFVMFPRWSAGAPQMVGRALVERPWQFSTTAKIMDSWNSPTDKIMLRYKPEYLKDKVLLKIPFTEDAFYSPPLALSEFTNPALIFHTKEFQFYWGEALNNPNTLQKFARMNIDVDWLKRGGGSPKVVGESIIITYVHTGETITAYIAGDKLRFVDGNSGLVIKEFETIGTGNKIGIVTQGEPVNELVRKYMFPFISTPYLWLTGSEKFKPQDTGNPMVDSLMNLANLAGFGAFAQSVQSSIDPDIPAWAKILDYFGDVSFAHTWLGNEPQAVPPKEKIRKAFRAIHGNYSGCGW